jgi:PadR family transcriptional regulator
MVGGFDLNVTGLRAEESGWGLTNATISSYSVRMRRKKGTLVPLEVSILEAALGLRSRGTMEAHGFLLAKQLRDGRHARRLTAYGTLYKALDRLERAGYLSSRWEEPQLAADDGRPRRRFYRVTVTGEAALAEARSAEREDARPRSAAVQPS